MLRRTQGFMNHEINRANISVLIWSLAKSWLNFIHTIKLLYKNNMWKKIRLTRLFLSNKIFKNILMRYCFHELTFILIDSILEIGIKFPDHDIFNDDIIIGSTPKVRKLVCISRWKYFKHLLLWLNIYIS